MPSPGGPKVTVIGASSHFFGKQTVRKLADDLIVNNIGDADSCIEELLQAERNALPECWYA